MTGKTGERTAETNREQKHAMGKGVNSVANPFLAGLRGQLIRVSTLMGPRVGKLLEFDLYSVLIDTGDGQPVLVFKGPGASIEPAPVESAG